MGPSVDDCSAGSSSSVRPELLEKVLVRRLGDDYGASPFSIRIDLAKGNIVDSRPILA